ncbi:MAG: RidA family protein [Flavobacteriales bacterium]|nr:RidA family protein [Flavobacteriales bacterium]
MKQVINTKHAPAPIGPYNQAIRTGNMVFISGQIALNPETGKLETGNVNDETKRVMENLKAILSEAGLTFDHVIKTSIFLSDMGLFAQVNEIYGSYFTSDFPARETVAVAGLPKGVNVEISVIAAV